VGCGNTSGQRVDKFGVFHLTPEPASLVAAPLIMECYANMVAGRTITLPSKMK